MQFCHILIKEEDTRNNRGQEWFMFEIPPLIATANDQTKAFWFVSLNSQYWVSTFLWMNNWLCALDFYLSTPKEIAIIGPRDNPATSELLHAVCSMWLPNKVVGAYDPNDPTPVSDLKLLENRHMINNQPTVYICEHYICQAPVTDTTSLDSQLKGN